MSTRHRQRIAEQECTQSVVVRRLNREIAEYLKASALQQRLHSFGLATDDAGTPEPHS